MPDMQPQTSYDVLVTQVHAPVFFGKLASDYGREPSSREDAIKMLKMAGKLRNSHEMALLKEANAKSNMLDSADENLDNMLSAYGYNTGTASSDQVKAAALQALQDPTIREAATVFSDYMSQMAQTN